MFSRDASDRSRLSVSEHTPRVFISSTSGDLHQHREAARVACELAGVMPLTFEEFGPSTLSAVDVFRHAVESADIFIIIVGFRYGVILPQLGKSAVEYEYEQARSLGKPVLVFAMSDQHSVRASDVDQGDAAAKLQSFKQVLSAEHIISQFDSASHLKSLVAQSLLSLTEVKRKIEKRVLLIGPHGNINYALSFELELLADRHDAIFYRLDDAFTGSFMESAISRIEQATLIVADLATISPNVLYELGIAHALKKSTLLLVPSADISKLPADLHSMRFHVYDTEGDIITLERHFVSLLERAASR